VRRDLWKVNKRGSVVSEEQRSWSTSKISGTTGVTQTWVWRIVRLGWFCGNRVQILQDNCYWEVAASVCVFVNGYKFCLTFLSRMTETLLDIPITDDRNFAWHSEHGWQKICLTFRSRIIEILLGILFTDDRNFAWHSEHGWQKICLTFRSRMIETLFDIPITDDRNSAWHSDNGWQKFCLTFR